jgi:hypothetical protein
MATPNKADIPRRYPEESFMVHELKKELFLRFGSMLRRPGNIFDYQNCPIYPALDKAACKPDRKEISRWGVGGYAPGRGPHDATVNVKGKEKQMAIAADVYLDAVGKDITERQLGDLLCKHLIGKSDKIGLKQIIWNGILYPAGKSPYWYPKAKNPAASASDKHTNHLHIEFKPEEANQRINRAGLLAALGEVEEEFRKLKQQ